MAVLDAPAEIETPRLRLRLPVAADARAIYDAYGTDPDVTRYLGWRPYASLPEAEARMSQRLAELAGGAELSWVIARRADPALMGLVSLFPADDQAELGYVLARAHWGRGYVPEAARAVVDWALSQPALSRVWAVTDVENRASARVLDKIGMECEGVLRRFGVHPNLGPEPRDCLIYARTK